MSESQPKSERTTAALRELLFEQIEGVRDGSVDAHKASAVAKLAQTLLKSLEVEMHYLELRQELGKGNAPSGLGELELADGVQPSRPVPTMIPRTVAGKAHSGSR